MPFWTRITFIAAAMAVVVALALAGLSLDSAQATPGFSFTLDDPVGDTFGSAPVQHDIVSVSGMVEGENVVMRAEFAGEIVPPTQGFPPSGIPFELTGFLLFDVDQDPTTGVYIDEEIGPFCPNSLGMGVDVIFQLFLYEDGFAPLLDYQELVVLAQVPVEFQPRSFETTVPIDYLGGDMSFNMAAVLGANVEQGVTDCFPGEGALDVGALKATPEPPATPTVAGISPTTVPAATPTATVEAVQLPDTGDGAPSGGGLPAVALSSSLALAAGALMLLAWRFVRIR